MSATRLEKLWLYGNTIGEAGALALTAALGQSQSTCMQDLRVSCHWLARKSSEEQAAFDWGPNVDARIEEDHNMCAVLCARHEGDRSSRDGLGDVPSESSLRFTAAPSTRTVLSLSAGTYVPTAPAPAPAPAPASLHGAAADSNTTSDREEPTGC